MSSPPLAPAGSSTYSSGTMYVGDGTWDSQRNTFLLPNLQGLNLATTQYNGMGNRFAEMPGYSDLIRAHGIIAGIVFLIIVPSAIMIKRFHDRYPLAALRVHIWLQIITLFLVTVVFILGYMAVGPARSQTNPHHGIGLTIYILILVQFIGGWWVHGRERRKRLTYMPVKAAIHHWLGRLIALLGLAQVPLGLALYGSPAYLFVLYTLATAALIVAYFILSYRREKYRSREYSSDYSYASGSGSIQRRESSRLGNWAKAGAAGLGLGFVANRLLKRREERNDDESRGSAEYLGEEKYSRHGRDADRTSGHEGGFKRWILGFGTIAAASYWIGGLFGRRHRDREYDDDTETYTETFTGTESSLARTERIEEGRTVSGALPPPAALPAGPHPLSQVQNAPSLHTRTPSQLSEDSYLSERGRSYGWRNALVGLTSLGIGGAYWKNRRDRKERERLEALKQLEIRDEQIARRDSRRQRYTGDGFPRHGGRRGSLTTDATDPSLEQARRAGQAMPNAAGALPIAGGAAGPPVAGPATSGNLPGPPPLPPSGAPPQLPYSQPPYFQGTDMRESHAGLATAAGVAAGAAAGLATGETMNSRRRRSRSRANQSAGDASVGSPPVSVNVKWHPDGRRITVRRLPEEEMANERARRHRPAASVSSLGASDPVGAGGEGWRRTEARERAEALEMQQQEERARLQAVQQQLNRGQLGVPNTTPVSLPPPPPVPGTEPSRLGMGSTGSPGTWEASPTETSADYAGNRKRRRAERAAAERARGETRTGRVEFS